MGFLYTGAIVHVELMTAEQESEDVEARCYPTIVRILKLQG